MSLPFESLRRALVSGDRNETREGLLLDFGGGLPERPRFGRRLHADKRGAGVGPLRWATHSALCGLGHCGSFPSGHRRRFSNGFRLTSIRENRLTDIDSVNRLTDTCRTMKNGTKKTERYAYRGGIIEITARRGATVYGRSIGCIGREDGPFQLPSSWLPIRIRDGRAVSR